MAHSAYFQSLSELCQQPNFAWYQSGETVALVGIWAQKIAIGWLTWESWILRGVLLAILMPVLPHWLLRWY